MTDIEIDGIIYENIPYECPGCGVDHYLSQLDIVATTMSYNLLECPQCGGAWPIDGGWVTDD